MRRVLLVASCATLLCSAAHAQVERQVEILPGTGDPAPVSPEETTRYIEAALPKARDLLDRELIDYPSARFRDVRASGAPLGLNATFCGFINARNRAGGFTGWEPFLLSITNSNEALYVGVEGSARVMIPGLCGASGRVPIDGDYSSRLAYR